jgi:predicted dehydrogenase
MSTSDSVTRRTFLASTLGSGAAMAIGAHLAHAQEAQDEAAGDVPPQRNPFADLRIAYIGTGGIGGHHIEETAPLGVRCECYCDVDTARYGNAQEAFPEARAYQDYRRMFEKEHRNFDAVMIGTPDHHHYPAAMMAMQLGKHVYVQKPLTHTPWEARELLKAAQRYKVATQMGNQGHAGEGWRLVYEWIRGGALGEITEVHTWTNRPVWPQGMARSEDEDVPPRSLDWDAWLGPAAERPFRRKEYHPFNWRGWWDFGCGALGDMACHTMDGIFWALEPGHPTSVEPLAMMPMNHDSFPKASMIRWRFPSSAVGGAFDCCWYDGGLLPTVPAALELDRRLGDSGNLFIGTKATMLVQGDYGNSPRIIPETLMQEVGRPAQLLERSPGHVREWLLACVGEQPLEFPKSNFAYSAPMTETIALGNIALRMGRRLEWDGAAMKFTNLPEANAYVSKEYRSGWTV